LQRLTSRNAAVIRTPFGRNLFVACDDAGVIESRFVAQLAAPSSPVAARGTLLRAATDAAEAYFARRLVRFEVPLVLRGTPLQLAVWHAVADLPVGALVSYGEIARAIGRPGAPRGVASALAKTPLALFIPAHRVVGADGRIKGAAPNAMRRRLLAFEGIRIR
jgi:methylated-DNA-[protein]-cysteine S-methyltransferase